MKSVLAFCLSFAAMMAGCSQPPPRQDSPADPFSPYAVCDFAYPDGKKVDCSLDLTTPTEEHVPETWTCIETLNAGISRVALWSDRNGHLGVAYQLGSVEEGGVYAGKFAIDDGHSKQLILSKIGRQGFVRFPNPVNGQGHVILVGHEFHVRGAPADALRVSTTLFQDEPWYVYSLERKSEEYYFMSMDRIAVGSEERWVPSDNHTFSGPGLTFVSYEPMGYARFFYYENRVAGSALPTPGKDCSTF